MAAPTNISAATAIELGPLPNLVTQNVHDAGVTYTVWYKYSSTALKEIGFYAYGDLLDYGVRTKVWIGTPSALTAYLEFNTPSNYNDACQVPVDSGVVYYFEILTWDATATPAVLTVVIEDAPDEAVTAGDIFINTERPSYPLTILDSTNGDVKKFFNPFPSGEYGATLPSGYTCVNGRLDDTVSVYNGLTLIASQPLAPTTLVDIVVGSNRTNLFYIGDSLGGISGTNIYTMGITGVLSSIRWNIPSVALQALAANLTDTILYWAEMAAAPAVSRYDIVNNIALSNLVAGIAGYMIMPDMFVLQDGSILVGYVNSVNVFPVFQVKIYSAAGATLHTHQFNFAGDANLTVRIACGIDDPTSYWIKRHRSGGQVTYYHILVADGSEIASFTIAEFQYGVSTYNFPLDGEAHYGCPPSCAFWLTEIAAPTPPDISGIYFLNTPVSGETPLTHDVYRDEERKIPNPTIRTALMGE